MPKTPSVSWHVTGRWCFSHQRDGKRKTYYASPEIPNTAAGERRARDWMRRTLDAVADVTVVGDAWEVGDLRTAYLEWLAVQVEKGSYKPRTLEGHRKQLRSVCQAVGSVVASELTAADLDAMLEVWNDKKHGPTTCRNRLASLQALLSWAAEPRSDRPIERLIPSNPVASFRPPQKSYGGPRYAPADELARFVAWVLERAGAAPGRLGRFERLTARLILFVCETGCRPGEACVLRWEHVDLDRRVAVLPPELHKTGRTGRPRIIPLPEPVAAMLADLKADPERHPDYVFTHRVVGVASRGTSADERADGSPWNSDALATRFAQLKDEAIEAKILGDWARPARRFTLYVLRHTLATNMQQQGVSVENTAAVLGNSPKVVWETYTHMQPGHLVGIRDSASKDQA